MNAAKITGSLVTWFPKRFFGFVHMSQNGVVQSYYLHGSQIASGVPYEGVNVSFTPGQNDRGGLVALDANILNGGAAALAGGAK